jgi:hypothetical protein
MSRHYVILLRRLGRLIDLANKGMVYLDRVEVLVLDEADRNVDMGFIPDIGASGRPDARQYRPSKAYFILCHN